jgi:hypothetical protein
MPAVKRTRAGRERITVPLDTAERRCLEQAARKARVSISYYLRESALILAQQEGFTPKRPPGWVPQLKAPLL